MVYEKQNGLDMSNNLWTNYNELKNEREDFFRIIEKTMFKVFEKNLEIYDEKKKKMEKKFKKQKKAFEKKIKNFEDKNGNITYPIEKFVKNTNCVIIVDVSNIAYHINKANIRNIKSVRKKLLDEGFEEDQIEMYADASLYYKIKNKKSYLKMLKEKKITQCTAGKQADKFILERGKDLIKKGKIPIILSNDQFKEYIGIYPQELWNRKMGMTFSPNGEPIIAS